MIFIDAPVFISAFTISDNCGKCRNLLESGGFVTNTLVIAESANGIGRIASKDEALQFLRWIFRVGSVNILDVDKNLVFSAMMSLKKSHLSFLDCIHYSTAETYECDAICTYDKDFDKLPIKRIEP